MPNKEHPLKPSTVLGFDFGMKHIGVAVGQSITHSATPLKSLQAFDGIPDWQAIQSLIDAWHPTGLIVGLPLTMDGSEQAISFAARRFMNRLREHFQLPVFEVDERLSSWAAKDEMGTTVPRTAKKRRAARDKVHSCAAALLIEQWYTSSNTLKPLAD
jgi:putative holliday junction resolvase